MKGKLVVLQNSDPFLFEYGVVLRLFYEHRFYSFLLMCHRIYFICFGIILNDVVGGLQNKFKVFIKKFDFI